MSPAEATKAPQLTTKSGKPVRIGTGSGTKWQKIKKARDISQRGVLLDELVENLTTSIKTGFRHLDTAEIYTTHPEIAEALRLTDVPREDLFICTKYNPGVEFQHALYKSGKEAVDTALQELGVDYIDSFLIHFPFFNPEYSHGQSIQTVWRDLMEAKKKGKVRYIGVSNFAIEHLKIIFDVAQGDVQYYPQINQIEFHPYLQDQSAGIRDFCREHNILLEAYGPLSPLFRIVKDEKIIEDHPLTIALPQLATKYGRTEAQILLRYTVAKGLLPVTTSSKVERQKEALAIYDFELEESDVSLIDRAGSEFHFRGFFHGHFD